MEGEEEEGEEDERPPRGARADLRRIWKELDSISFFLLIAAISTCSMCSDLSDIEDELEGVNAALKDTNTELRETRKVFERVLEQQRQL
mgnify:CR=1 FL=1